MKILHKEGDAFKVVFLDIDGVICMSGIQMEESKLKLLKSLIDRTDAKIVLSSTWRLIPNSLATINREFPKHGITAPIDVTTCLENHPEGSDKPKFSSWRRSRASEILRWIESNDPTHWVIIDDDPMLTEFIIDSDNFSTTQEAGSCPKIAEHFVQTNYQIGLTDLKVTAAVNILT